MTKIGALYPKGTMFKNSDGRVYEADGNYRREDDEEVLCDHCDIDHDERCCLDCGKDLTEQLMSDAYDRAKDRDYD